MAKHGRTLITTPDEKRNRSTQTPTLQHAAPVISMGSASTGGESHTDSRLMITHPAATTDFLAALRPCALANSLGMAHQQSSEPLRALGQLDEAALAKKLLPLLRRDKSAGSFALACKQLRRLCHGNQRELKLTGANCQHLGPLELDAFSRPFPACSSVAFTASSTDDLGLHFNFVLPLLARLPNLQSLQLNINSSTASQPAQMGPALQLMRLQLPQLRSLQLALCSSWDTNSQRCWEVLGTATQLTKLAIHFKNRAAGDPGISLEHLSALQPLGSGLQHLELGAEGVDPTSPQACSFLSSFSGLTSLKLPLINNRSGLAAISSCTALQQLAFVRHGASVLDAAECAALAQLTWLTRLEVPSSSDEPALLAALRCLSGLQELALRDMSSSHLPVLAALTKLTRLQGSWVDEPTDELAEAGKVMATCPLVTQLWMSGPFPLAAFPGARWFTTPDTLQPSRLAALSQQMKKLELLHSRNCPLVLSFSSLDPSAPGAERVGAVRSLGQLPCFRLLEFTLNDDAEAAALGTVTQLQRFWLSVPPGSSLSPAGLLSVFFRLGKLRDVIISLPGLRVCQTEAMLLLSGLSSVSELTVIAVGAKVWNAAAAAAREVGLSLPADLLITPYAPWAE